MILILTDSPTKPLRTIGAYRIATELRKHGCDVEVIDFISRWKYGDLISYIKSFDNLEWVGISTKFYISNKDISNYTTSLTGCQGLITAMDIYDEKQLLNYLNGEQIPVVVGGPSAELVVGRTKSVDYICLGYADKAVIAVHNHIKNNSELIYTLNSKTKVVYCDKDYADINLNDIETEYVDTDFIVEGENLPIEISRGCIFKCAFCTYSHTGKKPGTYIRSKESIKKDIQHRWEKYKTKNFRFTDDTFNDSIDKMTFIKEIRDETTDFIFWSYGRLDLLAAKPEMVDLVGPLGWKYITFGIETFNREAGSKIGKGADPEKMKAFLKEFRQKYPDVFIIANLIVGLPNDTIESAEQTVQWFIDNPEVASKIKVTGLGIPNPSLTINQSKIALDPGKYGYKIKGDVNEHPVRIKWKSEHMNWKTAKQIAERLSAKIKEELQIETFTTPTKSNLNGIVKSERRKFNYSFVEDMEEVEDNASELVNTYINAYVNKKLTSRGLI